MTTMSRRKMLAGAGAVAAVGAAPVALATDLRSLAAHERDVGLWLLTGRPKRDADADAELLALGRERGELIAALDANSARHEAAVNALPKWAHPGWPLWTPKELTQHWFFAGDLPTHCPSLKEVRAANRKNLAYVRSLHPDKLPVWQERCRARTRAWIAKRREQVALREQVGLPGIEHEGDVLCDRLLAVDQRIEDTPARTPAGLAVKLRYLFDYIRESEIEPDHPLCAGILRDVESMASGRAVA